MSEEEPAYAHILESDLIRLKTSKSSRIFRIHGNLLALKCSTIHVAYKREFQEKADGVYVIQDTKDETVVRFIEWAYKGSYSVDTQLGCAGDLRSKDTDDMKTNHPLLSHVQVYIFGHIYGIHKLQALAYDRLTENIEALGRPAGLDYQTAAIELLDSAFSNLHSNDQLLNWLAHFAAWCINELRLQPDFHSILPKIANHVIQYISPNSSPPWKNSRSKLQVPHRKFNEEEYDSG